jgi:hypothetical protein
MLVKSTPRLSLSPEQRNKALPLGVNFINIFAHNFRTKFWRQSQNVTRKAAKT